MKEEEIRVRRAVGVTGREERRKKEGGVRCTKRREENMRGLWKQGKMGKREEVKAKMKRNKKKRGDKSRKGKRAVRGKERAWKMGEEGRKKRRN